MRAETVFSQEHIEYVKNKRKHKILVHSLRIALLVLFFALWEGLTAAGVLDAFIVSSPSRCVKTIGALIAEGTLWLHIGVTLMETVVGFIAGSIMGIGIAALLWYSTTASKVLEPYLVVLNALPKIALGPVIIVWIGSGMGAIITITLLISVIVTVMGVQGGFNEVDPEKILLMRTFGAGKSRIFRSVVLPASVPTTVATLKINVGMSWVGVIVGEFLSSKNGLGYLLVYGGQVFRLDIVMASIIILCLLAAGMYYLVSLLQKAINKAVADYK